MNIIIGIGLLLLGVGLWYLSLKGVINDSTIQTWANIAGILALIAAIVVLMFPNITNPPPTTPAPVETLTAVVTPTWKPEIGPSPIPHAKIAYTSDQQGINEIFTMNLDGTLQTRLTNNVSNDSRASWSPDGEYLLFASDIDGNRELYMIKADGTELKRLTDNNTEDYGPAWSTDGMRITYYSDQDGDNDIYVLVIDNLQQIRLTNNNYDDREPDWSTDGKQVVYESHPPNSTKQICLINSDGSGETCLTDEHDGDNLDPTLSPDGQYIAFFSNRDGNYEIYIMRSDGTNPVRLTDDDGNDFSPDFSSDGHFIFFHSNRTGNYEIYRMNNDGSGLINLTNSRANDRWAAVEP